ncbi:MAG: twin-arginine translocase TatA/TatE family subunit, partial [Paracoccaceae bacterium]
MTLLSVRNLSVAIHEKPIVKDISFNLGAGEILIILVFALIFIGPKKLPELARTLGKSFRELQKAKDDFTGELMN